MSYYVKDNEIYIHCIGKDGNILKYIIDGINADKSIINFNYNSTPNISQKHIIIDKVDNTNINLKSAVKVDDSIKDGEHVKCSMTTKICEYNQTK